MVSQPAVKRPMHVKMEGEVEGILDGHSVYRLLDVAFLCLVSLVSNFPDKANQQGCAL